MKTSTKNTIITGICSLIVGILGTLGITNINSTNTNNNEITINIDGKEISLDSSEYGVMYEQVESEKEELNTEIQKIKKENTDLKTKNSNLKKENTDLKSKLDEPTTPVVDSTNSNETIYLMKDCPPYEVPGYLLYDDSDGFKIDGETCSNGFSFGSPGPLEKYYVLFNLNQKYTSIEFDFGHIDGSGDYECELVVYLDGNYYTTYTRKADEMKTHEKIDTSNVKQLKFAYRTGWAGYYGKYGLSNITAIYK